MKLGQPNAKGELHGVQEPSHHQSTMACWGIVTMGGDGHGRATVKKCSRSALNEALVARQKGQLES
jgi:hypothetical protein